MHRKNKIVLTTVIATSVMWLLPLSFLFKQSEDRSREIAQLHSDIALISDKDTIQIARKIKNSDYSYEEYVTGYADQVAELEASINGMDSEIYKLNRQIESIKDSYSQKLKNSELKKYHLESTVLSSTQLERADEIAYLVACSYEEYGVLPSVAVGQAMQETQLGVAVNNATPNFGWWGVIGRNGYATYTSLEDGVNAYLKCVNNGLYNGALFNSSYSSSLLSIQNGGYCEPKDGYASRVVDCIESYNFSEYDEYYLGE